MTEEPAQPGDDELAGALAERAGALLLTLRENLGFGDPGRLRAAGDRESHELLLADLARARPGDHVLSEEGRDDLRRLARERVWIVDPLDGTREFAEQGREDWAVHVALWSSGELVAGAVALPAQAVTLRTGPGGIGRLPAHRSGIRPRVVVSRTRPPAVATSVAEALGAEVIPLGSAGAKVCAVAQGRADVYVHAGGQYEWDSAAPVAVARQAGLHTSRIDGSALMYNQRDPLLPDLLVCRRELAAAVLAVTAR